MFPILENLEEQISPLGIEERASLKKAHLFVSKRKFKEAAKLFADLSTKMENAQR